MSHFTDFDDDETIDPALPFFLSPHKNAQLAKRDKLGYVVDFTDCFQLFVDMPTYRRMLLTMLLAALRDRFRQIRFEPWKFETEWHGYRLIVEVNDQTQEMEPPPHEMMPVIIRELKRLARLDTLRRRLAGFLCGLASRLDAQYLSQIESRFWLKEGEDQLEVVTTVYSSVGGDRVYLTFPDCPASLSERAQADMTRIFDYRYE